MNPHDMQDTLPVNSGKLFVLCRRQPLRANALDIPDRSTLESNFVQGSQQPYWPSGLQWAKGHTTIHEETLIL